MLTAKTMLRRLDRCGGDPAKIAAEVEAMRAASRAEKRARAERVKPKKGRAPGKTKAQRKAERNKRAAEIRAAVMARADGKCEWCGAEGMVLQWAHIFEGGERTAREDVDTTAAACADCHLRGWHRNQLPTLRAALAWALRLGFTDAAGEIEKKITKVEEARRAPSVPVRLVVGRAP